MTTKTNGAKLVRIIPRKNVTLEFEDGDWAGARIVCSADISFGTYIDFNRRLGSEDEADVLGMIMEFGDSIIISWNLADPEGVALSPDGEGLKQLPVSLIRDIFSRWSEEMTSASSPLGEASDSGKQPPELMDQMVPLSSDQPS